MKKDLCDDEFHLAAKRPKKKVENASLNFNNNRANNISSDDFSFDSLDSFPLFLQDPKSSIRLTSPSVEKHKSLSDDDDDQIEVVFTNLPEASIMVKESKNIRGLNLHTFFKSRAVNNGVDQIKEKEINNLEKMAKENKEKEIKGV